MSVPRLFVIAYLVQFGLPAQLFAQDNKVTVDGYVRDSSNKPVAGVKVSLYATGKADAIDTARTDENGYYKISKKIGSTYDIMYTHSRMDLAAVELLVEDKNQQISIKMYRRGEARVSSVYHENLHAAERMLVLMMSLKEPDRKLLISEYIESGALALFQETNPPDFADDPKEMRDFLKVKRELVRGLQKSLHIK